MNGLYDKYTVTKNSTGENVTDCFVLRPDRDPAALAALRAYALEIDNVELSADLLEWIARIEEVTA